MDKAIPALFRSLTQGIYVVGVSDGHDSNAFTASWVMQVSFTPMMLALSINPNHSSYKLLKHSGKFSVNVLAKDQVELAAHFGNPASSNKLSGISWGVFKTGAPVLSNALAYFECHFDHETPAGDHRLILGRVVSGELLQSDEVPLTYQDTGNMDGADRLFPDSF